MSFQPNNVVTGEPIVSTAGRIDNSQITDWYYWFFEPITYTDGVDDSQITDWYAWFFEPITYANTELTQDHELTSTSVLSSNPQVQTTSVTENHPITADSTTAGVPFVGTTALTEDYNLSASDIETQTPTASASPLTQEHSISVLGILSGQVIVSTAGLIQNHGFQANDLSFGQPVTTDPDFTQNNSLSSSSITTGQAEVSSVTMAEDENFIADNIISGVPEVNPASMSQNNSFDAINILTGRPDVEDATDPNVIYEEVTQRMFGGWPKRLYEHTDLAISRGHSTGYRTLYKFGYNPDVNGAEETVWADGGDYLWLNGAVTMFVSSSSANDANSGTGANTILIQGLDEDYNEIEETIILNGQTQVTTQLSYLRVYRAYVTLAGSGGTSGGTIYVGSSGATSGVPNGTVYASLALGNQTQIAAYTVPAGFTLYLDEINFTAALSTANKRVNASFHTRDFGSNVFRTRFINVLQSSQLKQEFRYPQAFPEKTDMECRVYTDSTNNPIAASFQGVLIKND